MSIHADSAQVGRDGNALHGPTDGGHALGHDASALAAAGTLPGHSATDPPGLRLALLHATPNTRAQIVGQLQRAVGNASVQRVLAASIGPVASPAKPHHASAVDAGETSNQAKDAEQMTNGAVLTPPLRSRPSITPPTIQRQPAPTAAPPAPRSTSDPQRQLVERILDQVQRGGITVAVYVAQRPNVRGAAEFRQQAAQFAVDHQALGIQGTALREGVAMEIRDSLASVLEVLSHRISELLSRFPELTGHESLIVPVRTLAIFTHGLRNALQAGPNAQWIRNSLGAWVQQITPYLSPSPQVLLYACSTAGTPARGQPFAEALRQALQVELEEQYGREAGVAPRVWGHQDAGHTTANYRLVEFGGGAASTGGRSLVSELTERFAQLAIERAGRTDTLSDPQRARISRRADQAVRRMLRAGTGRRDPTNVYVREIPQMGIDRVWRDLSSDSSESLADLNLSPEARARAEEGLEAYKERFATQLRRLEGYIRSL